MIRVLKVGYKERYGYSRWVERNDMGTQDGLKGSSEKVLSSCYLICRETFDGIPFFTPLQKQNKSIHNNMTKKYSSFELSWAWLQWR